MDSQVTQAVFDKHTANSETVYSVHIASGS